MVMELAKNFYAQDPLTREYMRYLDTSSAQALIAAHINAGIYELTQELICNRKFIIRHAVVEALKSASGQSQVLILAAGQAPLSLEVLSRQNDRIAAVYEIDVAEFGEKKRIYQSIAADLSDKVVFFQGDIRSHKLLSQLSSIGFDPSLNTVIVIEGITHYMTPAELQQVLELLTAERGKRWAVIDFGPPYDSIAERVRPIARQAYGIIEENCYRQAMTKYSSSEMRQALQAVGGEVVHHYTIHDIEKLVTGRNKFFPEKNSGWLEYMVARI